jgi:hypothetical protein
VQWEGEWERPKKRLNATRVTQGSTGERRCAGEGSVEGVGGAASRPEQDVVRENEREKAGQVVVSPRDLSRKSLDDTFLQRFSDSLRQTRARANAYRNTSQTLDSLSRFILSSFPRKSQKNRRNRCFALLNALFRSPPPDASTHSHPHKIEAARSESVEGERRRSVNGSTPRLNSSLPPPAAPPAPTKRASFVFRVVLTMVYRYSSWGIGGLKHNFLARRFSSIERRLWWTGCCCSSFRSSASCPP